MHAEEKEAGRAHLAHVVAEVLYRGPDPLPVQLPGVTNTTLVGRVRPLCNVLFY